MIDDSFYFGVEEDEQGNDDPDKFPMTYPFSATVPQIGLALLKVRRGRRLLSYMDQPRRLFRAAFLFVFRTPPPEISVFQCWFIVFWEGCSDKTCS